MLKMVSIEMNKPKIKFKYKKNTAFKLKMLLLNERKYTAFELIVIFFNSVPRVSYSQV